MGVNPSNDTSVIGALSVRYEPAEDEEEDDGEDETVSLTAAADCAGATRAAACQPVGRRGLRR